MVHQAYARAQLSPAEADQYVADMAITGEALGVIAAPRTVDQLHARLAEFRPALRGTSRPEQPAECCSGTHRSPRIARGIYRALAAGGVATQPVRARSEVGLPAAPGIDRLLLQPAAWMRLTNIDRALAPAFQRWLGDTPIHHA